VLVAHAVDVATIVTGIALRMCCAPLFAACNGTAQQWTTVSSKVRAACRSKPLRFHATEPMLLTFAAIFASLRHATCNKSL